MIAISAADIISGWIDAARARHLGGGTIPLLWLMRDHAEGFRAISPLMRPKVDELLASMERKAVGKQAEYVAAVKAAIAEGGEPRPTNP